MLFDFELAGLQSAARAMPDVLVLIPARSAPGRRKSRAISLLLRELGVR